MYSKNKSTSQNKCVAVSLSSDTTAGDPIAIILSELVNYNTKFFAHSQGNRYSLSGENAANADTTSLTEAQRKERAPYLGNEDTVFAEGYVPRMAGRKVSSKLKPSSGNLLSPSEYARFSSNMNDKNFRDYQYAKRPSGGVIVAMDNLLVYTDAKDAPVAVLEVFDDDIVTINNIQQDAINLEKEGFDIETQRGILQSLYGEGSADLRKSGELQKTGRENRGRAGSHEGRVREGDRTEVSFEERSDEEVENKRFSLRETDETVQEELATLKELHALTSAHRMTDKEAGWMAGRVLKDDHASLQKMYDTMMGALEGTQGEAANENKNDSVRLSMQGEGNLSKEDIEAIKAVGRKSVFDFTKEEMTSVEAMARSLFREIGTKSPFFRNWFGDWRSQDTSPVSVVKTKSATKGDKKNLDTGWKINVGKQVFRETTFHKSDSILRLYRRYR